ncbi:MULTISPECIES: arsenical pump-driving ATPase [Planococcus]|uniref:Arsenical pump-driving ATPase n=1 Tax=Planococcus wigleyi TaxID=2762216 RepID=A0ABR8WEV7_9BACL|nr:MULTISPECIES: arsenical pump-driving ATPase [Planococcus]MBD8015532.1 arsenical pump-driving ATPase [Planococcus wigleyi]MDN3437913.1 arsenical pump-driving ATPase [Planococcus sp. APC 3900]
MTGDIFKPADISGTPFLFFTGKGGVGKTSTASATAVALADSGKRVLLVSTDPASNLQDVFNVELTNEPQAIEGIQNLFACNLDPEEAARAYRNSVVGPYRGKLPEAVIKGMEEQLSGACTVEIAAFDEFTKLLADKRVMDDYDHILFDTAPTGHTLRLLKLPTAWSGFLDESTHGASCLGPLAGLDAKKELYASTMDALSDPSQTALILVARPDTASFKEAARASQELQSIGIENQLLILNGIYSPKQNEDPVSQAFALQHHQALQQMPQALKNLPAHRLPFVAFPLTGITNLRRLFTQPDWRPEPLEIGEQLPAGLEQLKDLVDHYSVNNTRVILTMGKGGVGKTTVASLLAVGLAEKGHPVHLTTTDPAAHLADRFEGTGGDRLTVSRIDPELEIEAYKAQVLAAAGPLDEEARAYLEEDLRSPCTEEIAVFRAFAEVVAKADNEIVIIDTAPTGHTLLLLDAAQTYHKELARSTGEVPQSVQNLLPRLRNPEETDVLLVTLPEATPVFEAARLQKDLERAGIVAKNWVINQSLGGTGTMEALLQAKAQSEWPWIQKVSRELAARTALIPWQAQDSIGYDKMKRLITTEKGIF